MNTYKGAVEYIKDGLNARFFHDREALSYHKLKYGGQTPLFVSSSANYTFKIPKYGERTCFGVILIQGPERIHGFMEDLAWPMVLELADGTRGTVHSKDTSSPRPGVMHRGTMFIFHNDVIFFTNPLTDSENMFRQFSLNSSSST